MSKQLKISVGQYSSCGRKPLNQDFHAVCIPEEPSLSGKGIAVAIADGISSSRVSQIASETAVKSFLDDYYCTSDSWSVKLSVQRVLLAINSWLYAQNQRSQYRYNKDRGYVCTFTSMVFKSASAYVFHIGDARVYRFVKDRLEPLTEDNRTWVSSETSYLSRALGISQQLEIDYQTLSLEVGDIFLLTTDGVYEHLSDKFIHQTISALTNDLNQAATAIVEEAYQQGSDDNLTAQIIRIEQLPYRQADEIYQRLTALPFPPSLEPRMLFDGYEIIRDICGSSRSHVVLARDMDTNKQVVIKMPSVALRSHTTYLERFLMEEWIAKRLNSAHVLKSCTPTRKRNYLYIVNEFIQGQTLAQWMIDNPKPNMETVRNMIEQIARGLQSFHRQEMLHQDLRPHNIMVDNTGTVKIIDFGSTFVAGLDEIDSPIQQNPVQGTAPFTAPEYFLGEYGTKKSDLYSLGIIAFHMLSGRFPYGVEMAKTRTKIAQRKLTYQSVLDNNREIPSWVDAALKKAVQPNPYKRYAELSEFIYDLRHPNPAFLNKTRPPLIERNPVFFWQSVSFILVIIVICISLP